MLNVKKTASVTLAILISLAGQAAYAHHHPQHEEGTCQRKPVYAEGSESTVLYYNYIVTSDCKMPSMGPETREEEEVPVNPGGNN